MPNIEKYTAVEIKSLLERVDHTLLSVTATDRDYIELCNEGLQHGVASICIPPSRVELCISKTGGQIPICTVVGFPNGYSSPSVKAYEAELAIQHGATEIDMVVDIGKVREKDFNSIFAEIRQVRAVTEGYILKVIIETSLLAHDEKVVLCQVVGACGADFIKTSTGFATGGATFEDVALLRKHVAANVKVKASGGINSLDDAFEFIKQGADRLGTSRIVKILQGTAPDGY